jgi:hypothetical protein
VGHALNHRSLFAYFIVGHRDGGALVVMVVMVVMVKVAQTGCVRLDYF